MTTIGSMLEEFREHPTGPHVHPVLTLTEKRGFMRQDERFRKRLATEDTSTYKVIRRNDIAFNPYLLWAGAVAQNQSYSSGVISPLYPTFRVRDGFDPRYVGRFLLLPATVAMYDAIAFGSVPRRRRTSVSDFLKLQIPAQPPAEEQRRIAEILDQTDALRVKQRQVLDRLDSLRRAILHDTIEESRSQWLPAGELMPSLRNGVSPSTTGTHRREVLTLTAVTTGRYRGQERKSGLFDKEPGADKRVDRADLLICRGSGNPDLVGVGVVPDAIDDEVVFPDTVIAGRIDTSKVNPSFLEQAWSHPSVRSQIRRASKTTNGTFKISQQGIAAITVPVPSASIQNQFVKRTARIAQSSSIAARAADDLDELFASLQSRAFHRKL